MNGRLALALVFVVGGAGIAMAGAQPQATLTPSEAQASEGAARVKGMVDTVDRANGTLVLTGDGEQLVVELSDVPAAVRPGNALVAEGEIVERGSDHVLEAHEVQMGCPSKYGA